MPMTLVDRLPLPSLKVYSAGSVVLLSAAVYYAMSVTSDPSWRANATLQRQAAAADGGESARGGVAKMLQGLTGSPANSSDQLLDVVGFMLHEPLCMWSVINIAYCSLVILGVALQRAVFGKLRVSESQRLKDKFWNYVFYKFIFVFGVVNVQYADEVLLWLCWFTAVGFLSLMGQLCKDRYEYLSSSPNTPWWTHARLLALLGGVLAAASALLGVAVRWGLPVGKDTFAFMAAECLLVVVPALHVAARYVLAARAADAAGAASYYTHFVFDSTCLAVELAHVVHMVALCNLVLSMASLVLLVQLRHLLRELQARLRRHRAYTHTHRHMAHHYPMASKEEVEKNQDNCAICWEPMKEARKLPCAHLFHNSCLCQWVQQDPSCPTCRRSLQPHRAAPAPRATNHLFHFDGSRYVSWLPSFSVEVTRVRAAPPPDQLELMARQVSAVAAPPPDQLELMARQVQQLFPQFGVAQLSAHLQHSRSPHLTVASILDGEVVPEEPLPPPPPAPAPVPAAAPSPADDPPSVAADTDDDIHITEEDLSSPQFAESARAREAALRARRRELVRRARALYLRRDTRPAEGS